MKFSKSFKIQKKLSQESEFIKKHPFMMYHILVLSAEKSKRTHFLSVKTSL